MLKLRAVLGHDRFVTLEGEIISGREAVRRGKKTRLTYKQLQAKYPDPWWAKSAQIFQFIFEGRSAHRTVAKLSAPPHRRSRHR